MDEPETRLAVHIDAHGEKVVPWSQKQRGGTREDRMLRSVTVSLPPKIGDYSPAVPPLVAVQADEALTTITRLDSAYGEHLASLSVLLLRAESVASSKIEQVEASMEDFARASHGTKSNASATSMVASAKALDVLISSVSDGSPITLDSILVAHRVLMADDSQERIHAGRLRNEQNWIGGSDHSPRNALYVPPPDQTVEAYLVDLLEFSNRDDVPVLAQAAVAHAQFESIHPFTDGNGRIGRALINAILRRRGVTRRIVVPLASALVAKKETYFEVLAAYREGDAGPIIQAFAHAARTSAHESETSARRLADLPEQWMSRYVAEVGRPPRAGSAARRILDLLPTAPFFTAEEMEDLIGVAPSSVYGAIEKLAAAGILRPLTNRRRNQVWSAGAVIDELEDLGDRVAGQMDSDLLWQTIRSQVLAELLRHDEARRDHVRELVAEVELPDVAQLPIDIAWVPHDLRITYANSVETVASVREKLDRLAASDALRQLAEATNGMETVREAVAQQTPIPEPLRESLDRWTALGERLARETRLPESVRESLDRMVDQRAAARDENDR